MRDSCDSRSFASSLVYWSPPRDRLALPTLPPGGLCRMPPVPRRWVIVSRTALKFSGSWAIFAMNSGCSIRNVAIRRPAAWFAEHASNHCESAPQHAWSTLTPGQLCHAPAVRRGTRRLTPTKGRTCEAWIAVLR